MLTWVPIIGVHDRYKMLTSVPIIGVRHNVDKIFTSVPMANKLTWKARLVIVPMSEVNKQFVNRVKR